MFGTILDIETDGQLDDISIKNYQVANININVPSFIDFSFITKYKETWYSWVRACMFIFLIIYHINQIVKFLRGFSITDGAIKHADKFIGGGKK